MAGLDMDSVLHSKKVLAVPSIEQQDVHEALECTNPSSAVQAERYSEWAAQYGAEASKQ